MDTAPSLYTAAGSAAYRRINLALFLAGFATFSLLYCPQPLLPEIARAFAVGPAASSLALSLTTAVLAFAVLLAGALSASLERRPLMTASITLAALCNIAAALTPHWHELLALRALEGLALGGVPVAAIAYLSEEIAPASLGQAMGLYVAGTALGGMAGRVLTAMLSDALGWRAALAGIGLLGLVSAIGFLMSLPPQRNFTRRVETQPQHHLAAWYHHLRHRGLVLLFAIGGLVMGSYVTVYNYSAFRLTAPPYSLNQTETGLIFGVNLVGMVTSAVAGGLADRRGRAPVLAAGILITLAGLALTIGSPLPLVIGGLILVTGGFFATHAVASGWVGVLAASDKSHAASLYLLFYYLGSSIMGSSGGWFWADHGWNGIALFTGSALSLALLAGLWLRRFN